MRVLRVGATLAVAAGLCVLVVSSATTATTQLAGPPSSIVQFGYVRSLVPVGGTYRMRFDPALWLSGETARRAAVEDGAIPPGEPVPNDYYIRNESRKQLTYTVPRSARVTVLVLRGGGPRSTPIAVAELAALVHGRNPRKRKLYGPGLGYWVRIVGDRALSLEQQYQP